MAEETTPLMLLILPGVSETFGPEWAEAINAAFRRVDAHDHSEDGGSQVTPAGMLINAELDFRSQALLNAIRLGIANAAAADTAAAARGSIQRVANNLYWVNAAGVAVQITNGNSVVSAGSGAMTLAAPGAYPYTVLSSDAQKVLAIDSSAARTINLPAATTSMFFMLKDAAGLAQTNNITVHPDGTDLIEGVNDDYLVNENLASRGFISDGVSKWYVV